MWLTRDQVLEQLCELCSCVAEEQFNWKHSSDCFCGKKVVIENFRVEQPVLDLIKAAVHEEIRSTYDNPKV